MEVWKNCSYPYGNLNVLILVNEYGGHPFIHLRVLHNKSESWKVDVFRHAIHTIGAYIRNGTPAGLIYPHRTSPGQTRNTQVIRGLFEIYQMFVNNDEIELDLPWSLHFSAYT